jgi:hypothetical protein
MSTNGQVLVFLKMNERGGLFRSSELMLPISHLHSRDMSHEQLELFVRLG